MAHMTNPARPGTVVLDLLDDIPAPATDASAPEALVRRCPRHAETPLVPDDALARMAGVAAFHLKDETERMGLGSFKATGAAYVIASHADEAARRTGAAFTEALAGRTYVTASAGNHGLSVAAGAAFTGARAVIYLARTVPDAFADRLRAHGAEVRVEGATYEESMAAAERAAEAEGMVLLSDSSWPGYHDLPHRLMEGYLIIAAEMVRQMEEPPTHLFLQAGVGGMAAALAAHARKAWPDITIVVVEPDEAPAVLESVRAGRAVTVSGGVSNMGRLDCKEPSLIALKGLARDADHFVTVSDAAAASTVERLGTLSWATTPSGAAGIVAALDPEIATAVGMDGTSRIVAIVSEGA